MYTGMDMGAAWAREGHLADILAVYQAPNFSPAKAPVTLQPLAIVQLMQQKRYRYCNSNHDCRYSGDHKFVQNNAAFLLANLSMSKVNLAVL